MTEAVVCCFPEPTDESHVEFAAIIVGRCFGGENLMVF